MLHRVVSQKQKDLEATATHQETGKVEILFSRTM